MSQPERVNLFDLPNLLTGSRLVLSIILFWAISVHYWWVALGVFVVASITDWLDGLAARRLGLVSSFGRGYDPLVDKIMTGGTFVFLSHVSSTRMPCDSGIGPWFITLILLREYLVTFLRGYLEQQGHSFGADWLGKLKMVLQCVCILWILAAFAIVEQQMGRATGTVDAASSPPWVAQMALARDVLVYSTLLVTLVSGVQYCVKAARIMGKPN